jgi:hypothetical protein
MDSQVLETPHLSNVIDPTDRHCYPIAQQFSQNIKRSSRQISQEECVLGLTEQFQVKLPFVSKATSVVAEFHVETPYFLWHFFYVSKTLLGRHECLFISSLVRDDRHSRAA